MHALIELIAGFVALLAAAALSQFGVDIQTPQSHDREIHRVAECSDAPAKSAFVETSSRSC